MSLFAHTTVNGQATTREVVPGHWGLTLLQDGDPCWAVTYPVCGYPARPRPERVDAQDDVHLIRSVWLRGLPCPDGADLKVCTVSPIGLLCRHNAHNKAGFGRCCLRDGHPGYCLDAADLADKEDADHPAFVWPKEVPHA